MAETLHSTRNRILSDSADLGHIPSKHYPSAGEPERSNLSSSIQYEGKHSNEQYARSSIANKKLPEDEQDMDVSFDLSKFLGPEPGAMLYRSPVTMRWAYLALLISISLTLAVLQEFLFQRSWKNGGLIVFKFVQNVSVNQYFLWRYAPTLVLVVFGLMVEATDYEMKRLQPYYCMTRQEGASADESMLVEPFSLWTYLTNPRLIGLRIFVSRTMTLLATLAVPTLQSASLSLIQDEQFKQHVVVNYVWSRLLSAALCLIAVLVFTILFRNSRDRSGLLAPPRGIATTGKMINRGQMLMICKDLELAHPDTIRKTFRQNRYYLRHSSIHREKIKNSVAYVGPQHSGENPHPFMLRWEPLSVFVAYLVIVLVIFTIVIFTQANNALQVVPWLLTALAVVIKLVWSMIDEQVRLVEPYYILSARHAKAQVLLLDYTGTTTIEMPFKALSDRRFLLLGISINSLLVEVLTVCMSSFKVKGTNFEHHNVDAISNPPTSEETFNSFWISFILAIVILNSLSVFCSIVWLNRRRRFLSQLPGTLATSLILIYQNKFLFDLVGTERLNMEEMEHRLVTSGKKFGLGWFRGRDGELHFGIDEEELSASAKSLSRPVVDSASSAG
ncbi:uncharacterized protein LY89DRAFT_720488 [Mollisia scopiformis]|uniref:Uncharacterized protein n=1 Tax=Mollisia scopiformis TaxID=149040 RepID=A0A194X5K7_MOLSC|nr:uncharacterized protein LY89DRAFT_720488 [Mollisia scopiformis]KUJ15092.1 hypothetical protein LY89DRAFT_720488 [Mollisia scopiformis]